MADTTVDPDKLAALLNTLEDEAQWKVVPAMVVINAVRRAVNRGTLASK